MSHVVVDNRTFGNQKRGRLVAWMNTDGCYPVATIKAGGEYTGMVDASIDITELDQLIRSLERIREAMLDWNHY